MPYITTAERLGREEGLKKGEVIGEIRRKRFFFKVAVRWIQRQPMSFQIAENAGI